MCTEDKFHALERRMDDAENEIVTIKGDINEIKHSLSDGFEDMRNLLSQLVSERKEWSGWLRDTLTKTVKIAGAIILFACGITQVGRIASVIIEHWTK